MFPVNIFSLTDFRFCLTFPGVGYYLLCEQFKHTFKPACVAQESYSPVRPLEPSQCRGACKQTGHHLSCLFSFSIFFFLSTMTYLASLHLNKHAQFVHFWEMPPALSSLPSHTAEIILPKLHCRRSVSAEAPLFLHFFLFLKTFLWDQSSTGGSHSRHILNQQRFLFYKMLKRVNSRFGH